jgi:hypothetical protein
MIPLTLTGCFVDINRICLIFKALRAALACLKIIFEQFFGRASALFSEERLHKMTSPKATSFLVKNYFRSATHAQKLEELD